MKMLLFGIILIVATQGFSQDTSIICKPIVDEIPFEVIGNFDLQLSNKLLQSEMKGTVFVELLIDENGQIIKFGLAKLSLADSLGRNSIEFMNDKLIGAISMRNFDPSPTLYPAYVKWIMGEIEQKIGTFRFKKKNDCISKSNINSFIISLKVH